MKSLTLSLALAASAVATSAMADHRDPRDQGRIINVAMDAEAGARYLTRVLARDYGPSAQRAVFNAGMLAKEANDLVLVMRGCDYDRDDLRSAEREFMDVMRSFDSLQYQMYNLGRPSSHSRDAWNRLRRSVDELAWQFGRNGGGGGWDDGDDHGGGWDDGDDHGDHDHGGGDHIGGGRN